MSDWKPYLDELERRRAAARAMGAAQRIVRLMMQRGKLDARTRIDLLFDEGSFVELGALVGGTRIPAGSRAEREGILKWGGKMFQAQRRATVPKLHVTLRKSFGFGSTTMARKPFDDQTLVLAFPAVTMSSMPAGSGGRSAKLGTEDQAQVESAQQSGPWGMAAGMGYDDVIDPREPRNALIRGLELTDARRTRPRGERREG